MRFTCYIKSLNIVPESTPTPGGLLYKTKITKN